MGDSRVEAGGSGEVPGSPRAISLVDATGAHLDASVERNTILAELWRPIKTDIDKRLRCAVTLIQPRRRLILANDARPNSVQAPYIGDLGESLVDEDERDENGETLLGESGDVPDERAEVEGDDDEKRHHDPDTDPETEGHEVQSVLAARQNTYPSSYRYSNSTFPSSSECRYNLIDWCFTSRQHKIGQFVPV